MYYHTSFIHLAIIVFAILVNKSIGVSILQDNKNNHQLVPIKPSPLVEEVQQPSEETLSEKSSQFITRKANDFFEKRDNNKEKIEDGGGGGGGDDDVKQKEKTTRKISGGSFLMKGPNCCGSRFQVSDRLEDSQLTTKATETTRYSETFHNRPENDRYSWQTYPRPGGSSSSGNSLYGSQGNPPDRYGSRPSYGQSEYGRPGILNSLKPLRPGYDYGNSDSGAYGSNGYEVNHRPGQGNSGGIYFTGANRPPGNYGVYGSNADQDEFPADANPEGQPRPTNIHTQKAVALKALAGVALLGAAAALAANPVLLPLAGKKKRSTTTSSTFDRLHFPYKFILDHVPQIQEDNIAEKFWSNGTCLSRLICEGQREFIIQIGRDKSFIQDVSAIKRDIDKKFNELIFKGTLQSEDLHQNSKMLMTILKEVKETNNNCNAFICNLYNP